MSNTPNNPKARRTRSPRVSEMVGRVVGEPSREALEAFGRYLARLALIHRDELDHDSHPTPAPLASEAALTLAPADPPRCPSQLPGSEKETSTND